MWWLITVLAVIFTKLDFFNLEKVTEIWVSQVVYIVCAIFSSMLLSLVLNPILSKFSFGENFGSKPNIKVYNFSTDEKPVIFPYNKFSMYTGNSISAIIDENYYEESPDGMERWKEVKYYFSRVFFENKKRRWSYITETAKDVRAVIHFYDGNMIELLDYDFIGRWANQSDQPKSKTDNIEADKFNLIDMVAGDSKYELDIAMKHSQGNFFVAFNNRNYMGNEFLIKENILNSKVVIAKIILSADNIDEDLKFYFELSHNGYGSSIDIRQLSKEEVKILPFNSEA